MFFSSQEPRSMQLCTELCSKRSGLNRRKLIAKSLLNQQIIRCMVLHC